MAGMTNSITDYVGIVKVGTQEYLTGSTLFGTCSTEADQAAKVVTIEEITSFTPTHGLTIHVLFTNSNTATNPTLQFSSGSGAITYPIYAYGDTKPGNTISTSWRAGAVVSFTYYDGTLDQTATAKRWIMNSGTDTGADGLASVALANVQNADDVKAIEALSGTSGYLKKTGENTWSLDTNTYSLSTHTHGNITNDGKITTAISVTQNDYLIVGDNSDGGKVGKGPVFSNTVSSQSTTTKFLREDGTWAAPSYITNTHYEAHLITADAATDKANEAVTASATGIFLNLVENNTVRNSHAIVGAGGITIGTDADGKITFTGKSGTVTSITLGSGLTSGTSQSSITTSGTISIKEGGVTNAMLAGSISNDKLANSSVSIAGETVSLGGTLTAATLREKLELSAALRFIGKVTSDSSYTPSDGNTSSNKPTISGVSSYTPIVGDVVLDKNSDAEYVCIAVNSSASPVTYTWERLGRDSSWALDNAVIHNTLTSAAGDMIYASTANTPDRLAVGTNGQYLKSDGSKPVWETFSASTVGLDNVTNHAQVTSLQWDKTNKKITYKVSEGTAKNVVTFAAGSNISLTAEDNKLTIANTYSYTLSAATSDDLGGIRIGYTQTGKTYPVVLDSNNKAYVSVPWTDTNTKVIQVLDSASTDTFPLLFSDNKTSVTTESITSSAKRINTIYIQPSTGTLTATKFVGNGSGLTGITTDHIGGTGTGTKFLRQDGWKTLTISYDDASDGEVITGFTFSGGTLPSYTQGTKASASVSNGVLTIVNQGADTFTKGSIATLTNILRTNVAISAS